MEKRGHVRRQRAEADRRVVRATITTEGTALLRALDKPVRDAIRGPLAPLGTEKLVQLTALLEQIRIQMDGGASI